MLLCFRDWHLSKDKVSLLSIRLNNIPLCTLILHEQVYKYVLSVTQHVQIIHSASSNKHQCNVQTLLHRNRYLVRGELMLKLAF